MLTHRNFHFFLQKKKKYPMLGSLFFSCPLKYQEDFNRVSFLRATKKASLTGVSWPFLKKKERGKEKANKTFLIIAFCVP